MNVSVSADESEDQIASVGALIRQNTPSTLRPQSFLVDEVQRRINAARISHALNQCFWNPQHSAKMGLPDRHRERHDISFVDGNS